MSYWQGKTALVTGASSGLGLAISAALSRSGASVAMAARGAEKLEAAARLLTAAAGRVQAIAADVTRPDEVDRLVQQTVERFGRLDILVNCAGRSARGKVLDTTVEQFQELLDVNFLSAVSCTRAAAPHLLATRGHLVNIGSLAAKSASRYMGAYPASKFPLAAYSQQLRLELGPQGLHVLLVCPGPIAREERRSYIATDASLPPEADLPGGGVKVRLLDADEVARKILRACESRRLELVIPAKARLLFAIGQLWPRLGDWVLRRMT